MNYITGVNFTLFVNEKQCILKRHMKIAIDESGDGGRRIWRGSTKWFVVAAVVVPDADRVCGITCQLINRFKEQYLVDTELHFSHNSHEQHEQFFAYMKDTDYFYIAVAIDKRQLLKKKPHALINKRVLFKTALDRLFSELHPYWDDPLVLIDRNTRRIDRFMRRHLFQEFGTPNSRDLQHIKNIIFVDSRYEPLVQFADYIAGAVRHHVDSSYDSKSYEDYLTSKGKIFYL